jgi:Flp pilus assembly pilin Flp
MVRLGRCSDQEDRTVQIIQLNVFRDFAFAGLLVSLRTSIKMAQDKSGTTIMAYAFLAATIALAAIVAFDATGTAVANMYDAIATAFVASMPPSS